MPGISGIELLKRMQPELHPEIKVVFYTAYNKYLLEALRASAFDYLLKPYMPDELQAIIERYRSYTPQNTEMLEQSLHKLLVQSNVFAIQTLTGLMLMSNEKVVLFQYTKEHRCWQMLHADDSKYHKLRANVTSKELLFISNSFIHISQDCIVNMNYLVSIENKTMKCTFCHPYENVDRVASQRYFKKIKEQLEII
jgi:two-component system LytT family response regulator